MQQLIDTLRMAALELEGNWDDLNDLGFDDTYLDTMLSQLHWLQDRLEDASKQRRSDQEHES